MAETTKVVAKMRDRAGKGGARSSRRDGLIPAVIYGDKQAPVMIAVEPKSIERELHKEGFFNHQIKIDVEGTGYDVLPRDVQVDPVTDKPLHLDFLRVGPDSIISVQVPVHFKNEGAAPGRKLKTFKNVDVQGELNGIVTLQLAVAFVAAAFLAPARLDIARHIAARFFSQEIRRAEQVLAANATAID